LNEWIVLMEATPGRDQRPMQANVLMDLLGAVAHAFPVALHHPERYAVQLKVVARDPVHALASLFSAWLEAVNRLGAPTWEIVRAEVLTRAEFEEESRQSGTTDATGHR
jgi:hypothetical protein